MHSATRDGLADGQGLWDWDLASDRIHFSPRWNVLVGCEGHEVGNTPDAWLHRVHPEERERVSGTIDGHLANGDAEFSIRHRMLHADGSYRWVSCCGVVHRSTSGTPVRITGSHVDITAEVVTDPVTRLPNRLMLLERLTHSIERASQYSGFHFAVLVVDLDRLADGKARPGSEVGDPFLTAAARRLETSLRMTDEPPTFRNNDMVARLQGGQFAILLDGLKEVGHAVVVGDRMLAAVRAPFTVGTREVFLSASLGVAVSATGYSRAEDVLLDAQTALRRAQQLGATRCEVFDTAVLQAAQAELQLEADLKNGLGRGEFRLHYQPIVSLESNAVVGFEALVRWEHPILGLIPPLEFIPLAEETGFAVPLGRWVLREACRQLRAWQDSVPGATDVWMSVNVSVAQVSDPTLVEEVGAALRESAIDPRCLVLELTESLAMERPGAAKTVLMQLRALGLRISMDDFGTGHSSLAYLRQFPVDALKVDRAFVRGVEANTDMAEILKGVTAMARQLGLYTVVEGIENEKQLAMVRSLKCEYGQGYLFSRPVVGERAAELLARGGRLPRSEGAPGDRTAPGDTVATHEPEQPARKPSTGLTRLQSVTAAVSMAAAGVLFVSVGGPARLLPEPPSQTKSISPPTRADAGPTPTGPAPGPQWPSQADIPARPSATEVGSGREASSHSAVLPPSLGPGARTATTLSPQSFTVVHQHRLGSCQGILVVSKDGIAFLPNSGNDAFRIAHGRFLHAVDEGGVTIKSADKAYRFKLVAAAGPKASPAASQTLAASIAMFH